MHQHNVITLQNEDGTMETKLMLSPDEEIRRNSAEVEIPHNQPSSPKPAKKKLEFNMASKIQIIPNNRQGQLNTGYIKTLGGILKVAEIVLSFMAFVLAICADRNTTTASWTEHIAFQSTVITTAILLGYVCFPHITIRDELTREGLIVVELIFYGINTVLYFIAIWLMVHLSIGFGMDGRGAAILCAVVCLAITVLFAMETFMKIKAWRGENDASTRIVNRGVPNA
ncbi:unnamed protein product, partial [Mesorhabditis belari]|uniref:MARVEL domain-containing protein n=1 Tax=Mesorhabditis belari TaxID=2138241 RepID=A0AAF3J478_9BILA